MRRVSASPHIHGPLRTDRAMIYVIIALLPSAIWGVWAFGLRALAVLLASIASAMLVEYLLGLVSKESTLRDFSAAVTGLLVGMNMPPAVPLYIPIIASIRSALGASVFVTGSTSTLISGELADKLTGRYVEFSVFPFSYDEVVQFTSHDDEETLADYLKWGGFPVRFAPAINARTAIQDILSSIVERDILGRHPEFDRWNFRNFLSYILAYTSNRISTESLSTFISVNEKKISTTTCYKYLEAMREANLISMPVRFDIRRKEMLKTRRKSYATDPSLVTLQRGSTAPFDLGDILETVAYNELVSRGYEVHTGKTYNGEIDFVVTNRVKRCYIQVAYLLASEEVVEREFKAYSSVKDNWPKYVISLDKPDFSQRGIIHMNVRDFLTGRRKLAIEPCAICFRQSESR